MIVASIADIHLDERKDDSGESLAEQVDRMYWIRDDAKEHGAKLILIAGDIYERASTPVERNAAVDVVSALASVARVVIVYGNHDRPGDLDVLERIRAGNPIGVVDRPGIVHTDGADVACVPWPRKSWLAGKLDPGEDISQAAEEAMRTILLGFSTQWGEKSPRIVLAHAELGSAEMDTGQPVVGKADVELCSGDLLDTGSDLIALGHIHKHQIINEKICYGGSPRQTTFGQDPLKGYCLVEVVRDMSPVITHRKAPGRELVTIEAEMVGGVLVTVGELPERVDGNIFRIKYLVDESERLSAAQSAAELSDHILGFGAHSVKIVPDVRATHRTRSSLIQESRTNEDRVKAWWKTSTEPARASVILERLAELESETAAT